MSGDDVRDETVTQLVSGTKSLPKVNIQKAIGSFVHFMGLGKVKPEMTTENKDTKALGDCNIHTDRVIEARKPNIVVVELNSETTINNIAVP